MDKKNRPKGREKRVGSGSGKVEKRGSGLGRKTSGPSGGSGGFFTSQKRPTTQNQSSEYSRPTSRSTGGLSKIILVVLFIIGYIIISNVGGGGGDVPIMDSGSDNYQPETTDTVYDRGAYDVDRVVSDEARPKRTSLIGGGRDRATVMVYLLGTDTMNTTRGIQ